MCLSFLLFRWFVLCKKSVNNFCEMGCDEATYIAAVLVFVESIHRAIEGPVSDFDRSLQPKDDLAFSNAKAYVFILFFVLSMLSTTFFVMGLHNLSVFKNPNVQQFLPFLYMMDSVGALILGYSLYIKHISGVIFAMTLLTNFLMLHVLHGVFSGKGHNDLVSFTFLPAVAHILKMWYLQYYIHHGLY